MKKIKYLIVLFITVLFVTGCKNDDGTKLLEEALKNQNNVKNYSMIAEITGKDTYYSFSIEIDGDFDMETSNSHYKTTFTIAGVKGTPTEMYNIKKDDEIYVYTTENGTDWNYTIGESDEFPLSSINVNEATKYAGQYKSVKKVKSDIDGHTKLEVTIDKEKMNGALGENSNSNTIEIKNDLVMYIYVKDGYITKINLDLSDIIGQELMEGFTDTSLSITMSEHNKVGTITIPENIINSAVLK